MSLNALSFYCENAMQLCCNAEAEESFEVFVKFCRQWLPDPHRFLEGDGVLSTFEDGLQFLLSEILGWSEKDVFDALNKEKSDSTEDPRVKCLVLLLAIVCALRFEKTGDHDYPEMTFSEKLKLVLGAREDFDMFMQLVESVAFSESSSEFCSQDVFKFLINDLSYQQLSDASGVAMSNQTVSCLNMSELDLNKSFSDSPLINRPLQCKLVSQPRSSPLASETETDKSSVFNSPFCAFSPLAERRATTAAAINVPPLCNPRLSQSSPYAKLAQKNKSMSIKFDLLRQELEDSKTDNRQQKQQLAESQRQIDKLNEHVSFLSSQLMDCRDEKVALVDKSKRAEQQFETQLEAYEKLNVALTELKKENEDSKAIERHLKTEMDLLQSDKSATERREAVLLKQNEEMRDIYESEKRLWAKMQEENQARVHKLDAALEEISGQKHDLFLQLKEAKEANVDQESDFFFKFNTETHKLEKQLEEKEAELKESKENLVEKEKVLAKKCEENEKMSAEIGMLNREVEVCHQTACQKDESMRVLQTRIDALLATKEDSSALSDRLKLQLKDITEKYSQCEDKHSARLEEVLQREQQKFCVAKKESDEAVRLLKEQLVAKNEWISHLTEKVQKGESEATLMKLKNSQMEAEICAANEKCVSLETCLVNKNAEIDDKQTVIEKMEKDMENFKASFDAQLRELNERYKESADGYEKLLLENREEGQHIELRCSQLKSEIQQLSVKNLELTNEVAQKDKQLQSDIAHRERERERVAKQNSDREAQIEQLQHQMRLLRDEATKALNEKVDQMKQETEAHSKELSAKNAEIMRLRESIERQTADTTLRVLQTEQLEKDLMEKSEKIAELEASLDQTEQQKQHALKSISCLDEKIAALVRSHEEEMSKMKSGVNSKEETVQQLNSQALQLQNQLRDVNVKNLQLQSEIERKELSHANVIGELERQVNRLGDKNGSLAEDVKRVEKVLAQTKEEQIKKEKELAAGFHEQIQALKVDLQQMTSKLTEKEFELSRLEMEKFTSEKRVETLQEQVLVQQKQHEEMAQSLHSQINTVQEERQIAEESLEIETRNLTDKLLQLSGQLESSVAEKDSLLLENQKLCSESQTLRRDFDALVAEKALLESEKEFVEKQNGELQRQMNSVYVMSDDERRASNEEMAALQLRLAQMEQEAAEVDAMRDQLKALQNKLKSADRTADSFKRLYMSEKNKNGSVESDVKTAVPSISTMTRVTRAASSQFEPGVTIKQEIQPNVDDESVSRLRGSRQAVSASCLSERAAIANARAPLTSTSLNAPNTFGGYTMRLRSRAQPSQSFADSVPNDSLFSYPDILDMVPETTVQSRVSDLQRQENIEPRSLIRVCSYPVETITNTATVSRSSSANSNLNSSCSWNSLHSATSEELPELPGSVPPRAGGLGATVTETNSIRYSIRTTTANDENSANDVENRQREIDRRNSMYPSQLRSCYPMENFDTVASGPATRSNLGSRKRPMPKSQVSVNALFEDAPNQPKTPNAKKGSESTPQKFLQRVTKGRRSKVEPLNSVPESQDVAATTSTAPPSASVFMEFPNTPKDKKTRRTDGRK